MANDHLNDVDPTVESICAANEVIDSLSFTIQRQSALCLDLVRAAVEVERERCAVLAEEQARNLPADTPAAAAATEIAVRIRALNEPWPLQSAVLPFAL